MKQSINQPTNQTAQFFLSLLLLLAIGCLGWYMVNQGQLVWEVLIAQILVVSALLMRCWLFLKNDLISKRHRSQQDDFLASNSLLNSLSDGVIVIDNQGKIKFFNHQAFLITGYKPDEAIDIHYSSVLRFFTQDNQPLPTNEDPVSISQQTYDVSRLDLINIRSYSDKTIPISVQAAPIKDDSNEILIAFRDISRELDKEREQLEFISTASHEMRTPIATINGYLGLALNPKISQIDTKARDYILKAQSAVEHLGELFKNLLSISKAEDKSIAISPSVINLIDFVEKICGDFQPQLANHQLELIFAPTANRAKTLNPDILVYTDKNLLYEVISNLIENAIKYTSQGKITVNVSLKDNESAEISVADTGMGIPPEDIPHLFQKFYRVDNSQTREIGGTGLGLYLCRKIIENIHGRIWAESVVGRGSTFFVELKRIDQIKANQLANRQRFMTVSEPQLPHWFLKTAGFMAFLNFFLYNKLKQDCSRS